jgi:hypothetical protein
LIFALLKPLSGCLLLVLLQVEAGSEDLGGIVGLGLGDVYRWAKPFITIKRHHQVAVFVDPNVVNRACEVSGDLKSGECDGGLLLCFGQMSDLVTELALGQVLGDLLMQFGDFWGELNRVCGGLFPVFKELSFTNRFMEIFKKKGAAVLCHITPFDSL